MATLNVAENGLKVQVTCGILTQLKQECLSEGVLGFTAQVGLPREVLFFRGVQLSWHLEVMAAVVKGACSHLALVAEPGIIQKVLS